MREHELPGRSGINVSTSTNVSSWQGSDNSQVIHLRKYYDAPLCETNMCSLGQLDYGVLIGTWVSVSGQTSILPTAYSHRNMEFWPNILFKICN